MRIFNKIIPQTNDFTDLISQTVSIIPEVVLKFSNPKFLKLSLQ